MDLLDLLRFGIGKIVCLTKGGEKMGLALNFPVGTAHSGEGIRPTPLLAKRGTRIVVVLAAVEKKSLAQQHIQIGHAIAGFRLGQILHPSGRGLPA
ncbi:hypothetical protein IB267_16255 [Ensifer sp. ENS09]|uniref:hypothetical protein n=1 Tax=Ensifer sp. ENS09 TaxID=2769263 RepID=UPI00177F656B|nr:hypothetical protein [Ensifer sp. ENS09]MBD9649911.1 hypothetical protein [Ensifer sp. ENS09]